MIRIARKMELFSIVYLAEPEEAAAMAEAGADAIIAHVGTTIGGSIGVTGATCTLDDAVRRTQAIIDGAKKVRKDLIFLSHGGPICAPEDAAYINERTDCQVQRLERLVRRHRRIRFARVPRQRRGFAAQARGRRRRVRSSVPAT